MEDAKAPARLSGPRRACGSIDELVVMLVDDGQRDQRCDDRGQRVQTDAGGNRAPANGARTIDRGVNFSDESVPDAWNRLDESRLLSTVAERRPQPVECNVEAVIEVDGGIGPQPRPDLLARHDPAWLVEQQHEQPQRLAAQAHGLAAAR